MYGTCLHNRNVIVQLKARLVKMVAGAQSTERLIRETNAVRLSRGEQYKYSTGDMGLDKTKWTIRGLGLRVVHHDLNEFVFIDLPVLVQIELVNHGL